MSWASAAFEGTMTLLNMLGSVTRKLMRRKRTSYHREWRHRDNTGLGLLTLLGLSGAVFLFWLILVPGRGPSSAPEFNPGFEQVDTGTLVDDAAIRMPNAPKESFMIDSSAGSHHGSEDVIAPDSLLSAEKKWRKRAAMDASSILLAYPDTIQSSVRRPVFSFYLEYPSEFIETQTTLTSIERRGWVRAVTQEIVLDPRSRSEWSSVRRNGCPLCTSKQRSEMDVFSHLVELSLTDSNAFRKGWTR